MGKKTEELRSKTQKAAELLEAKTNAMNDAYENSKKLPTIISKLCFQPKSDERDKKLEKLNKEAMTDWAIYNQAREACEKAQKEYDAAFSALSNWITKKKETSKTFHSLKQKLARLKAKMS